MPERKGFTIKTQRGAEAGDDNGQIEAITVGVNGCLGLIGLVGENAGQRGDGRCPRLGGRAEINDVLQFRIGAAQVEVMQPIFALNDLHNLHIQLVADAVVGASCQPVRIIHRPHIAVGNITLVHPHINATKVDQYALLTDREDGRRSNHVLHDVGRLTIESAVVLFCKGLTA